MCIENKLRKAIEGLLNEPYGCPMCDSGKLRSPDKSHWDDCPFKIATDILNKEGEQSETGIWLKEQIKYLSNVEGEVKSVKDYAGGLSITFANDNKYTLKISKQATATLD